MTGNTSPPRAVGEAYLDFLFTARKRAHEMDMLNVRKANRIAVDLYKIARELKASEEGRNELRRLMEFSDPVVRALAAECSLGFDESRALAVLREVESSDNSYARSVASFNLVYWRTEHGLPMFEKPESPTGIPIGRRR